MLMRTRESGRANNSVTIDSTDSKLVDILSSGILKSEITAPRLSSNVGRKRRPQYHHSDEEDEEDENFDEDDLSGDEDDDYKAKKKRSNFQAKPRGRYEESEQGQRKRSAALVSFSFTSVYLS